MTDLQIHTASNGAKFPFIEPLVYRTNLGTPYLRDPGFAVISQPQFAIEPVGAFLRGFDAELGFMDYLDDDWDKLDASTAVCKVAGQLCYMSFGEKRTKNDDAQKYVNNIKEQRHGSVFEHANISILLWGDSRSLTHELVRHRVGIGYSQVSQRYVDGPKLRFVERPEFAANDLLHRGFEDWIDRAKHEYDNRANVLMQVMKNDKAFMSMPAVERRKRVNQAARDCLPNETEAPIVLTSNIRTFRHILENRVNRHAEVAIRRAFGLIHEGLQIVSTSMVNDYNRVELPDGTFELATEWRKV